MSHCPCIEFWEFLLCDIIHMILEHIDPLSLAKNIHDLLPVLQLFLFEICLYVDLINIPHLHSQPTMTWIHINKITQYQSFHEDICLTLFQCVLVGEELYLSNSFIESIVWGSVLLARYIAAPISCSYPSYTRHFSWMQLA